MDFDAEQSSAADTSTMIENATDKDLDTHLTKHAPHATPLTALETALNSDEASMIATDAEDEAEFAAVRDAIDRAHKTGTPADPPEILGEARIALDHEAVSDDADSPQHRLWLDTAAGAVYHATRPSHTAPWSLHLRHAQNMTEWLDARIGIPLSDRMVVDSLRADTPAWQAERDLDCLDELGLVRLAGMHRRYGAQPTDATLQHFSDRAAGERKRLLDARVVQFRQIADPSSEAGRHEIAERLDLSIDDVQYLLKEVDRRRREYRAATHNRDQYPHRAER